MRDLYFFTLTAMLLAILSSCSSPAETQDTIQTPVEEVPLSQPSDTIRKVEVADKTTCSSEEKLCIGFLIEDGLFEGNSFYRAAFNAVQRAEQDLLATVNRINIDPQTKDLAGNIDYFADQNYDIIVTAGPNLLLGTLDAAKKYPNIDFVGVNQNQFLAYENILGITFEEQKAAFLAGVLAAMVSENGTIGVVLAEVPPTVYRYLEGFEAGVYAIKPDAEILHAFYSGNVETAYDDPAWGKEMARDMIENKADVIFAAGGETAIGALEEVAKETGTLCIGADLDQYTESPNTRPCLVSSVVRNIEPEVFKVIAWSALGKFPTENIVGSYQFAPFYDYDKFFTADIKAYINEIEKNLANDTIPIDGTYTAQDFPQVKILQEQN